MYFSERLGLLKMENRIHSSFNPQLFDQVLHDPRFDPSEPIPPQTGWFIPLEELKSLRSGVGCLNSWMHQRRLHKRIATALDSFAVVGLTERLQDTARLIAWKLGWPAPARLSQARKSDASVHPIPEAIRSKFSAELAVDEILYKEAQSRFERLLACLVREAGHENQVDSWLNHQAENLFLKKNRDHG